MSIQAKIDQAIHHLGSISIQDFIEISNFDNELASFGTMESSLNGKMQQLMY
ncbi:hypothetical protein N9X75_03290 [Alphaproteobacteria bacterium]|nr:hypothetical protein [Alphaproteobacteria bacterium]